MPTGERIKKIRLEKGITQKQLAELLNTSQQNLAQYESGKRNPKIETLQKIADALDMPLIFLVEDDLLDAAILPYEDSEGKLIDEKVNEIMTNKEISLEEKTIKIEELMTQLQIIENYHFDNANRAYEYMVNKLFEQLNQTGKDKALEHIKMLTRIPEYRKE